MTKQRKFAPGIVSMLLLVALIAGPIAAVQAEQGPDTRPAPAAPGMMMSDSVQVNATDLLSSMAAASSDSSWLQAAADRLVEKQNEDGGWGWPLDGDSAENTIGPIAMGLAKAYLHTGDPVHLEALEAAGVFLLGKTEFSPSDGYLAAQLDQIFEVTTYTGHVKTHFYDKLANGEYDKDGTNYTTAQYVQYVRNRRTGDYANLAAWDLGMGLVGAASCGASTQEWINGTKAEIDELDGSKYYDVIGLAGALYGLAFVDEDYDPQAGEHGAAGSVADLADILASYQIDGGGFTWNSNYLEPDEDNETIQETAYAILALNEVNRATYLTQLEGAADYMIGAQLETGGWEGFPGSGENNEVGAEAVWGILTYELRIDALFYPYDEGTPRGVNDAPEGWGQSAWQGPASGKSNYHVWYDASGGNPAVNLEELFGVDHGLTVGDLESISYHTKKDSSIAESRDWWLSIYTLPTGDDDAGSWYKSRLHARPDVGHSNSSFAYDAWNLWSSDDTASTTNQLLFYDSTRTPSMYETLAELTDSSGRDYSEEGLKSITLQTDSGWDGFDGYVDGLTIKLTDGRIGKVNFEAATLWLEPSAGWVETNGTTTVDVMMSGSGFNGVQFDLAYNATLLSVTAVEAGSMWDGYSTSVVESSASDGTVEFGAFLTQMDTTLDVSEAQVATITFTGDADGISDLAFSNVIVSDPDGRELVYQSQDGTLEVYGRGTIEGRVELQGRFVTGGDTMHHEKAKVTLTGGPGGAFTFTGETSSDGTWSIDSVVEGEYDVLVEMSLYLTAERSAPVQLTLDGDGTADAGFVKLLGGDVNNLSGDPALGNNVIGAGDASVLANAFGLSVGETGYDNNGDINDDNIVNILDCSILGGNYGKAGPIGW